MKPKIIIVDENDNPVGVKERDDKDLKIIYRVAALWLTKPATSPNAWHWGVRAVSRWRRNMVGLE